MIRLLKSEFKRLFKNKFFIFINLCSVIASVFMVLTRRNDFHITGIKEYGDYTDLLFVGPFVLFFAAVAFVALFTGTEFSDGTIRNKLSVGHSRLNVYITELIVCSAANIIIMAVYFLSMLFFGMIITGAPDMSAQELITKQLIVFAGTLALTAFSMLITMSAANRSISAVVCLLLSVAMVVGAIHFNGRLSEPEYYEGGLRLDAQTNEFVEIESEINPDYLDGTERTVYEVVNDAQPVSHFFRIASLVDAGNYFRMFAFDFAEIILYSALGALIFKKKDLK